MDKQMKGSSLKKIGALLPWLWLATGYALDIWFQLVPGKGSLILTWHQK